MNISAKGIDRLADDPGSLNSWKALFNLTPRSWLTRSWVVQGVAFARHAVLRCGSALDSWARFCEAAGLFLEKLDEINESVRNSWPELQLKPWAPGLLGAIASMAMFRTLSVVPY
jgi:hypothetical protein